MGKGGNASAVGATVLKNHASSTLIAERKAKIGQEPKFYWASGDAMVEPHVARYVVSSNEIRAVILPASAC